ncbi:hypothetical protein TNCV_1286931 [Trichonephila clavipes]|nr:hypothetical protein TNCV_1286931 [Trichonephila clavipes]
MNALSTIALGYAASSVPFLSHHFGVKLLITDGRMTHSDLECCLGEVLFELTTFGSEVHALCDLDERNLNSGLSLRAFIALLCYLRLGEGLQIFGDIQSCHLVWCENLESGIRIKESSSLLCGTNVLRGVLECDADKQ